MGKIYQKALRKKATDKTEATFFPIALPRSVFFRSKALAGSRLASLPAEQPDRAELARRMRRFELFSSIPLAAIKEIAMAATVRVYRRGEFIWRRGDKVDKIALLEYGFVKAARRDRHGASKTYGLYGPGDSLGLFALFAGPKHIIDTVAVNEGLQVICIDVEVIFKLADKSAVFSGNLHSQMSRLTEALINKIEVISAGTMAERLAVLMIQLLDRYGVDKKVGSARLPISLTLEQISGIIDARLETVARVLSDWKRSGWLVIDSNGSHFSHLDKLRELLPD